MCLLHVSEDKDHIRWPKSSAPLCLTKIQPLGQEALRYQTHGTREVPDVSVFSRTRLGAGTATPFLVSRSDQSATCHGYTKPCSVLLSHVGKKKKKDKNVDLGEWRNTGCKEAVLRAGFGLGEPGPDCCLLPTPRGQQDPPATPCWAWQTAGKENQKFARVETANRISKGTGMLGGAALRSTRL